MQEMVDSYDKELKQSVMTSITFSTIVLPRVEKLTRDKIKGGGLSASEDRLS